MLRRRRASTQHSVWTQDQRSCMRPRARWNVLGRVHRGVHCTNMHSTLARLISSATTFRRSTILPHPVGAGFLEPRWPWGLRQLKNIHYTLKPGTYTALQSSPSQPPLHPVNYARSCQTPRPVNARCAEGQVATRTQYTPQYDSATPTPLYGQAAVTFDSRDGAH